MCGDGRHPPDEWGHLTSVHFTPDDAGWEVSLESDDVPPMHFVWRDGTWFTDNGDELSLDEGARFLTVRCFGS